MLDSYRVKRASWSAPSYWPPRGIYTKTMLATGRPKTASEWVEALKVMKRSRSKAAGGFFLAALIFSPVWGSVPPQPGTVNYIEGQASIGAQALTDKSVG